MFTWSRSEIWLSVVLAALIVIGGTGHLLLAHKSGQRPIVVEVGTDGRNPGPGPSASSRNGETSETAGLQVEDSAGVAGAANSEYPLVVEVEGGDDSGEVAPFTAPDEQQPNIVVEDRININRAQPSELQRLPGIGPALAARIVAYREAWGPFSAIEDILEVPGIGPVKFANMQHLLTVD